MIAKAAKFVLALAILMGIATPAAAGPVDCGERAITVGFYTAPGIYFIKDGQAQGSDVDILEELARRTGCIFTRREMSRARVFAEMASGTVDMSISGLRSSDRDELAWFAIYGKLKNYAVLRADAARMVHGPDDFSRNSHLQFGVVRTFRHSVGEDQWLDTLRPSGRVQDSVSLDQLIEKLKMRRVDAMFTSPLIFAGILQDDVKQGLLVVQDWFPEDKGLDAGLMLAKHRFSRAEADRWQKVVTQMREDGTIDRIISTRFSPELSSMVIKGRP